MADGLWSLEKRLITSILALVKSSTFRWRRVIPNPMATEAAHPENGECCDWG